MKPYTSLGKGALVEIQEMVDHSQKWHDIRSNGSLERSISNGISPIKNKLGNLDRDMRKLNEIMHEIHMGPSGSNSPMGRRSSLEETIRRYFEEFSKRENSFKELMKKFRETTDWNLKRHDSVIKGLKKKVEQLAQVVHSSITPNLKSINPLKTQEASPAIVEPLRIENPFLKDQFQEDPPEIPMTDDRTMAKLLRAPTEGYEDAIVIPKIAANNFELKHGLINLVQNKQFFGHDKEDPHAHIRYFNKITSTMRVPKIHLPEPPVLLELNISYQVV
nr:reverse transcriptase domain-containing protein [Tanacetum cinerariifolium]